MTFEVLSTFEVDRGLVGFDRASINHFQLLKEKRWMSYTEFSLMMGLYDTNYTSTSQYE